MTQEGLQKRIGTEKFRVDELKKVFCTLLDEIKNTSEEDGWHRLVIFSTNSASVFDGLSYVDRSALLYYLRRYPNLISKLSDKEKRMFALDSMKPYVFKWVSAEEKEKLGTQANYFRNIPRELSEKIYEEIQDKSSGFLVDVFSVFEFLLGKKNKTWVETSTHNISAFSGVPIENTRAALNELLKMKFIVMAYVPCEGRRGRSRMNIYTTLNEEEHSRAVSEKWLEAAQIVTDKNALNEKFDFTVTKYFYDTISRFQERKPSDDVHKAPQSFQEGNSSEDIYNTPQSQITLDLENSPAEEKTETVEQIEQKILPAPTFPPINIVMPEIPGLNQTLDEIKSCVISFTNIAESMQNSEAQKYDLLKNMIQANTKQREEYDNLYNQMVAMKKILNQKDRDKDNFVKAIQDALNMMMGKIISATDEFSKIPRHLVDEQKLQAHKAEVIKITVQTAEEIRKLAN